MHEAPLDSKNVEIESHIFGKFHPFTLTVKAGVVLCGSNSIIIYVVYNEVLKSESSNRNS